MSVKPKKHLGQHFLTDLTVCERMTDAIPSDKGYKNVLEIGPGTGALTQFLLKRSDFTTQVVEIDTESVEYLHYNYPILSGRIHETDVLRSDLNTIFKGEDFVVMGNFPYNISSQILFKILDYKDQIPLVVGMFQKEVAERVAVGPGTKTYGITSVLLQAYYDIDYLFTVDEHVFNPPPKVKSGVIRLQRNDVKELAVNEKLFKQVVKMSFNQRRKTIKNSLKSMLTDQIDTSHPFFARRPETLSVDEFIELTQMFEQSV